MLLCRWGKTEHSAKVHSGCKLVLYCPRPRRRCYVVQRPKPEKQLKAVPKAMTQGKQGAGNPASAIEMEAFEQSSPMS